ncbi:hypothetical protein N7539_003325 [Penicillium diatomitis]|uniref:Uncharacterized protein n=1 Tax=Penicillium diatomitis TaxID=2819901 RepID=A0A9X0BZX3_9EURO|nr:uncharacterized protein N7539_003325 [Penicillium diatomitis]KAJ5491758.1 hypothetical protein N7539_003325 [Penicillium diatomitis]
MFSTQHNLTKFGEKMWVAKQRSDHLQISTRSGENEDVTSLYLRRRNKEVTPWTGIRQTPQSRRQNKESRHVEDFAKFEYEVSFPTIEHEEAEEYSARESMHQSKHRAVFNMIPSNAG